MEQKLANPAPLGLMGFGMTTVLLNLHNAGLWDVGAMILAMGIFYGGMAQIVAGVLEFQRGNTFGTTAFTSYGFFWLTLVFIMLAPRFGWSDAPSKGAMVAYLTMWGLFTFLMFISTLRLNRAVQVVFASLTILFWLLAIRDATGSHVIGVIAGIEGIFCGGSAIYLAMAEVMNEYFDRTILPIGPVT
jgi:succinate-acetate transporter protein